MPYSIEMHFDDESNKTIKDIWRKLKEKDITSYMHDYGVFPHVALAVFDELNISEAEKRLEKFTASRRGFDLAMSSLGVFPSDESVLFTSPTVTGTLVDFHRELHKVFDDAKEQWNLYLPDLWVPHCTLGLNIPKRKVHEALDIVLEDFRPFEARVVAVQLVKFNPVRILKTFELKV